MYGTVKRKLDPPLTALHIISLLVVISSSSGLYTNDKTSAQELFADIGIDKAIPYSPKTYSCNVFLFHYCHTFSYLPQHTGHTILIALTLLWKNRVERGLFGMSQAFET